MKMMNAVKFGLKVIGVAIGLIPTLVGAALAVIYDSGDTRPIAPFLDAFESTETTLPRSRIIESPQLGAADLDSLLPIRSPGLTPGPVQPRTHDRPFMRPFFLIGSDALSLKWLLEHRDRLKEIGAVGMLVQADTRDDLRTVAGLATGLSIIPASATDIAKALGISHYPILITSHGIEQ